MMVFWQFFWVIGVILTLITNVTIKSKVSYAEWPCFWEISELDQKTRVLLKILVTACIILAGGTTVGALAGPFVFFLIILQGQVTAAIIVAVGVIPIIGTVFYVFDRMQLKYFNKRFRYISFIIFIVSSVAWTTLMITL